MTENKILEIACFNLESALIAQSAGADRIELCSNYNAGGVTPSEHVILEVRNKVRIPIHVIIRPAFGDFIYSEAEIEAMKKSILFCKKNKVDGIVFGVLTENHEIDKEVCQELIELAKPMSITFHRAIDHCNNTDSSIQSLINMGFNRVLTSAGHDNALEGLAELKRLQESYGEQIIIMPAGGIRSTMMKQILRSGCKEYHSAAITYNTELADAAEIKAIKQYL